jgi:hypothetical protein
MDLRGAMKKISEAHITFPKQSHTDIQFSNIGPTVGIANSNVVFPLLLQTPAHMFNVFCLYKIIYTCHMFLCLYLPLLFFANKQIQKNMHITLIQNKIYMHNIMIVIIERYM